MDEIENDKEIIRDEIITKFEQEDRDRKYSMPLMMSEPKREIFRNINENYESELMLSCNNSIQ